MNFIHRLRARRIVASQFKTGRFVFRGSRGQTLATGAVRGHWFSIDLGPAHVHRSGIVHRVELWNRDGELAMTQEVGGFMVSRKLRFQGKRLAIP